MIKQGLLQVQEKDIPQILSMISDNLLMCTQSEEEMFIIKEVTRFITTTYPIISEQAINSLNMNQRSSLLTFIS